MLCFFLIYQIYQKKMCEFWFYFCYFCTRWNGGCHPRSRSQTYNRTFLAEKSSSCSTRALTLRAGLCYCALWKLFPYSRAVFKAGHDIELNLGIIKRGAAFYLFIYFWPKVLKTKNAQHKIRLDKINQFSQIYVCVVFKVRLNLYYRMSSRLCPHYWDEECQKIQQGPRSLQISAQTRANKKIKLGHLPPPLCVYNNRRKLFRQRQIIRS